MRFLTAGESHGQKLIGIIEGFPAGIPLNKDNIDQALQRRQKGPGRGGRMQIEKDQVNLITGVRGGYTTGAPITLELINRDWNNWEKIMAWGEEADLESRKITAPRPGHADLVGHLKYRTEIRNILERASARETAMRVAVGNAARQLLTLLGIEIRGRVNAVGGVKAKSEDTEMYWKRVKNSEWLVGDLEAEKAMWERLEEARQQGESLGGIIEVQALNVPAGLGSHVQWDRKLDGKIAQAFLSVQAIKGISFGLGFEAGERVGSQVHDPILYMPGQGYGHASNNAGGIEGGMSNGEPIVIGAVMKPIPTLYQPLATVDIKTKDTIKASIERSDVCAVPAACIVLEHVLAWVIADAILEKFPGDNYSDLAKSWLDYKDYLRNQ